MKKPMMKKDDMKKDIDGKKGKMPGMMDKDKDKMSKSKMKKKM